RKAAEKKKQEQADKEKKPAEAADPNAEVPEADAAKAVDGAVAAAEQTFVEAPGEARSAAVTHLGGDPSQVAAVRTSFRQRAADIKDWVLKKTHRAEGAAMGEPEDIPYVAELEPELTADQPVDIDGVHPPVKDPVKDQVIEVIKRDQTEFDTLTDTKRRPETVAEAEQMQAALIYELYQLARHIPGLREVRDEAIPNIESARRQMNEGLPSTDKEAALGTMAYPDLFTPEQLVNALEEEASRQVFEGREFFGASFDKWVNEGVGATLKTKADEAGKTIQQMDENAGKIAKDEVYKLVTTLGLNQAWRLSKFVVGVPLKGAANILKTGWVVGTQFGSATMEKFRRKEFTEDEADPVVVKTAALLSRGGDLHNKLDRVMDIQRKLHSLRRDRADLQEKGKLAPPDNEPDNLDDAVMKQLWREVCDKAIQENNDAAVQRLNSDGRFPSEHFLEDTATGALTLNDPDLQVSFSHEHREQVSKKMDTILRNRTAIRDVCRRYVAAELNQRKSKLAPAAMHALEVGQFLFEARSDGTIDVELLIKPVGRRRTEYDEGGVNDSSETFSMHVTVPADVSERMLSEAAAGNTQDKRNILTDEALARVFEDKMTEPTPDEELGQTNQTEEALDKMKKLMEQATTATADFARDPSEANAAAVQELYASIHKQYQPDQLGTEITLPEAEQAQYNSFVMNVAKAKDVIQAVVAAKKTNEPDKLTRATKTLSEFMQARQKEFAAWNPKFNAERANRLTAKFNELADQAKEKLDRYPTNSTVTLSGRFLRGKEPSTWTVIEARNGVYRLEHDGKQMVMQENDLANWIALANKEAKTTPKKVQPRGRAAA
ncbi:MAG: hypothetical protein ACD_41C00336G0003, partial [uncultured bacterium]